jgi:hypothetical protein
MGAASRINNTQVLLYEMVNAYFQGRMDIEITAF